MGALSVLRNKPLQDIVIYLDAGHGGTDPGACRGQYREKDFTLRVVLALGADLERQGATVYYSRKTDKTVPLRTRTNDANAKKADLFISIHLNSHGSNAMGLEVLYYGTSSVGKVLAQKIQGDLIRAGLYTKDRGVKARNNLHVLRASQGYAALPELVFISSPKDLGLLIDNFDKYIATLSKSIMEFIGEKYTPADVKPKPPVKPEPPQTVKDKLNIEILGTHFVAAQGTLRGGRSYIRLPEMRIKEVVLNEDEEQFVLKNINFALVEIAEAMGLSTGWREKDRVIEFNSLDEDRIHFVEEERKADDKLVVNMMGLDVALDVEKINGSFYIVIGDLLLGLRDLFETLGLKVEWKSDEDIRISIPAA